MKVVATIAEFRAERARFGDLGFAPTMGYLHEGHISLMKRAKEECGAAAASIFVNPTQFGPNEDLSRYPRDLPRDLSLLEAAGVDLVFTPEPIEMYPEGFDTSITVGGVSEGLEGGSRPGHFNGVATVVAKLLNIVQPTRAYFGQKDAQQAAVIRKLALDLSIPSEIVICPTVREPDGLAMSSRNVYLSLADRQSARVLFRALTLARILVERGERKAEAVREAMRRTIGEEPSAEVDYVSLADNLTLKEVEDRLSGEVLASMAVRFGKTRLIDNLVINVPKGRK
ncbi:pantoate--beta-alanine ligase [Caulobacter segnis]|uniref:pantoate--beta-alanine ligase n=1 Tax=Caulobacter segnis TaxID=88688 RepID=UPI00240EBEAC|nr:pantoate--beta-alanine ligase [Caulobacter segnis]MDG2522411.1 pantoate--beta-alanine ligase [Caulobacter segnis]